MSRKPKKPKLSLKDRLIQFFWTVITAIIIEVARAIIRP